MPDKVQGKAYSIAFIDYLNNIDDCGETTEPANDLHLLADSYSDDIDYRFERTETIRGYWFKE